MTRKRRLHYKDLDGMRFIAFVPVFLFCALFLMSSDDNPIATEMGVVAGYIKQNSIDFFFFLSSFLLTSHALREYKYNKGFGFKSFYIRRMMRIFPLFLLLIVFAFILHPYIVKMLAFEPIQTPKVSKYLTKPPRFPSELTKEQYIYLGVAWTIYMFIQFYIVWGFIMKFFLQKIKYVSIGLIALGIAARLFCILSDIPIEFNVLSAGIPVGMGALTANIIRNDERTLEMMKQLPKGTHVIMYLFGFIVIALGYTFVGNTYGSVVIPLLTGVFFAYAIMEQTFGKSSFFKLHKNKVITRLGRISYGFLIYQSIILVIIVISVDSLNLDMTSIGIQIGFVAIGFFISWIIADVSYNVLERPIYGIKKEFKHS